MLDIIGGPGRDRTDDLFHAMEARSQLRHRPTSGDKQLFYFLCSREIRQTRTFGVCRNLRLLETPTIKHTGIDSG